MSDELKNDEKGIGFAVVTDAEVTATEAPATETPVVEVSGEVLSDDDFQKMVEEHDKHATMFAKEREESARQFCWDAGIQIVRVPADVELPEYTINIESVADRKIKSLLRAYPRLEWLGYLVGSIDHANCLVTVQDLVIPKQMVTGASVYNVEYAWNEGKPIIGVIHSHHGMGAFFSGTDDAYINQNHDVSIVVATAKGREIKSQVRVKAPCGGYYVNEKIKHIRPVDNFDEIAFENEFRSKIGQFTYNYTGGTYGSSYAGNGGGRVIHGGNFRGRERRYNSTGTPLFPAGNAGGRVAQTLTPQDYQRIYGGNGNRGSSNALIPSHSDVMNGASRYYATNGGYSTEGWDTNEDINIPDEFDDPHSMSETQLRKELLNYYSPEDVEDFIECDDAADELAEIYGMIRQGVNVQRIERTESVTDDNTMEFTFEEWDTGVTTETSSRITEAELDELEQYRFQVH